VADQPVPSRIALTGLAIVSRAFRLLGPFRRDLANAIGLVWYLRQTATVRSRAAANHRRANPSLSTRDARALARRSFLEYVAMILDSIAAEGAPARTVRRRLHIRGVERLFADGGAVLALPHFGNWDVSATGALAEGLRVTTVMGPVVTPFFTTLVAWSRRRKGLELYTPERAARGLLRALREGKLVALMADVPEAGPTVEVPYCGGPVLFSAVPARLAQATERPLLPMACWRAGTGWVIDVGEPVLIARGDSEAEIMSRVAKTLERHVLGHPEQWYPFHQVYVDDVAA